jgi:hypothetical protein
MRFRFIEDRRADYPVTIMYVSSNASQQFRQVMLSVPEKQQQIPIGLRVSVQFSACPAGQKPTAK